MRILALRLLIDAIRNLKVIPGVDDEVNLDSESREPRLKDIYLNLSRPSFLWRGSRLLGIGIINPLGKKVNHL